MWPLAVLIGDRINDQGFFDKKMYGHFAGPKKWPRRTPCQAPPPPPPALAGPQGGYKDGFHCTKKSTVNILVE